MNGNFASLDRVDLENLANIIRKLDESGIRFNGTINYVIHSPAADTSPLLAAATTLVLRLTCEQVPGPPRHVFHFG